MLGSDVCKVSVVTRPIEYNSFDDYSSSSDNEDRFYEDVVIGTFYLLLTCIEPL